MLFNSKRQRRWRLFHPAFDAASIPARYEIEKRYEDTVHAHATNCVTDEEQTAHACQPRPVVVCRHKPSSILNTERIVAVVVWVLLILLAGCPFPAASYAKIRNKKGRPVCAKAPKILSMPQSSGPFPQRLPREYYLETTLRNVWGPSERGGGAGMHAGCGRLGKKHR